MSNNKTSAIQKSIVCFFIIAGSTLIGLGIGKVFRAEGSGTLIGLGVGLVLSALILLNKFWNNSENA